MADKKIGEYYSPPVKMGKWEGFKKFLWNSETSQCLGRTGSSWGKYTIHSIPEHNKCLCPYNIMLYQLINIAQAVFTCVAFRLPPSLSVPF